MSIGFRLLFAILVLMCSFFPPNVFCMERATVVSEIDRIVEQYRVVCQNISNKDLNVTSWALQMDEQGRWLLSSFRKFLCRMDVGDLMKFYLDDFDWKMGAVEGSFLVEYCREDVFSPIDQPVGGVDEKSVNEDDFSTYRLDGSFF